MQFFSSLLQSSKVGVAFLSETKSSSERAHHLLSHIQGYTVHVVPLAGLSRGLRLLWSKDVTVQVIDSTKHYIFARIIGSDQISWVLGAIYGDASHQSNGMI
jgi:hypothetical protein